MFRLIGDTNIPFLSYRWYCIGGSLLIIVAGLVYQFVGGGLIFGIDFAGGTQITLKMREQPDLDRIRGVLEKLGVGDSSIQRFDLPEKREILIRAKNPKSGEEDFGEVILKALHADLNPDAAGRFDVNTRGSQELTNLLANADPDAAGGDLEARKLRYQPMATAVLEYRKVHGMFADVSELASVSELSAAARTYLQRSVMAGQFALLGIESVGPSAGADLRRQAMLAVAFSLLGMLVYIWVRFQFAYGLGAVLALFHDVLITLSALAVTGREVNLPTIAAILTLVGYSVNDTVVVFDRVRENLKLRRGQDLEQTMDEAINQTLSRTTLTSGLTLLVVVALYLFGGDVINTFAFVLLVGIIVGTYSSIFIASPIALATQHFLARRRAKRRAR